MTKYLPLTKRSAGSGLLTGYKTVNSPTLTTSINHADLALDKNLKLKNSFSVQAANLEEAQGFLMSPTQKIEADRARWIIQSVLGNNLRKNSPSTIVWTHLIKKPVILFLLFLLVNSYII